MASRSLLRDQLAQAWRETMATEYPGQLINSERGLQLFFCQHLQQIFKNDDVGRRLFVEPCLTDSEGKMRSPDLLICHQHSVIGAVEFKYKPCGRASAEKDLETLHWLKAQSTDFELSNPRYCGVGDKTSKSAKTYSLATDAVLCWAGVFAKSDILEASAAMHSSGRLLVLGAVTSPGQPPELLAS